MNEQEGEMGTDDYEVAGHMQIRRPLIILVNCVHGDDEKKLLYAGKRCFNCQGAGHFIRHCKAPCRQNLSQLHLNE